MQQSTDAAVQGASQDVWAHNAEQGLAYVGRHRRQFLLAAAALSVLALVASVVWSRQNADARAASAAFAQALAVLDRPTTEDRRALAEARAEAERAEGLIAAEKGAAGGAAAGSKADVDADADEADDDAADAATDATQRDRARRRRIREAERALDEEADRQGVPRFATRKERDEAGRKALAEVAQRWPNRPVGVLAGLQAASLAAGQGDAAAADKALAELFAALPDDDTLLPLVAERVAEGRRRSGDVAGAVAALTRVADSEHRFLADEAGLARAYLLEEQGEVAKAKAALEDWTLKFPDSPLQDEVRAELAALEGQAAGTDAAAAAGTP